MKQWEKLTAWLVVFALVAGLVGGSTFVQVSAAEENSDFAYVVNEDGTGNDHRSENQCGRCDRSGGDRWTYRNGDRKSYERMVNNAGGRI